MASKRPRIIAADLERQGAKVRTTRNDGYFVAFPDGSSLTFHQSESDPRSEKNTRARVLRAGFTWPFDPKR